MVVVMTLLFMEDIKITSLVNAQPYTYEKIVYAWCTNYTNLTEHSELQTRGTLHPCNVCETIRSTYCFEDLSLSSLVWFRLDRALNITQCGSFYVYQLPQQLCTKNITLFRKSSPKKVWQRKIYISLAKIIVELVYHEPDTACNDSTNGKLWVQV